MISVCSLFLPSVCQVLLSPAPCPQQLLPASPQSFSHQDLSIPPRPLLSNLSPPCHFSISQLAHSASWLSCLQSFPTNLFPTHSSPCNSKPLPKMLQRSLTPLTNVRAGGRTPPHGTTCWPLPNSRFSHSPTCCFPILRMGRPLAHLCPPSPSPHCSLCLECTCASC